jgi:hypothetical protein
MALPFKKLDVSGNALAKFILPTEQPCDVIKVPKHVRMLQTGKLFINSQSALKG